MIEEKKPFFEETQDLLERYLSNRVQLVKLQLAEKSARVTTLLAAGLIIAFLGFFVLLFSSIMLGFYFSEKLHSQFFGFGIVAVIYFLLLLLVVIFRKPLLDQFIFRKIVAILFDTDEDENSEQ
ncbi:MAG: phage holin family protein [Bacteroidota bacterium]|nr:phage holin family protein [Bacteroidota bacterium]